MKNKNIKICDAVIHPGESANLALPMPEQYSCAPMLMPIKVIHGRQKGPCLVLFSTLKGSELNGIEIVNRVVKLTSPDEISGTVIAIPVLNVYGLTHFPITLPSNVNLADCFPGSAEGTFGERLAYLFTQEILRKADYCIELQTGDLNHNILPQIYCNFNDGNSKQLAKSFQAPVVTHVQLDGNLLRQTTEDLQIPLFVYQAGEAMRFDENAISLGVTGVTNMMRAIDILPKAPLKEIKPIFSKDEDWVVAHKGGILHPQASLGQAIKKGELIGEIKDPFGTDNVENVVAPRDGIIVGINTTPLIHEGLAIFKIASFIDYDRAENIIEEWNKKQPDSFLD